MTHAFQYKVPSLGVIVATAKRYAADESGAAAIEYGLIAALIAVLCITGASSLGGNVNDKFIEISKLFDGPAELPSAGIEGPG